MCVCACVYVGICVCARDTGWKRPIGCFKLQVRLFKCARTCVCTCVYVGMRVCARDAGWRRPIGYVQSQVIFRKRAANYRALLQKMTYIDKASHGSSPSCITRARKIDQYMYT